MSNKVVPAVYRSIINDVIENVRTDFEQVGVEEAVLQELQRSWELRVAQSRVADFSNDARMGAHARNFPPMPMGSPPGFKGEVNGNDENGAAGGAEAGPSQLKKDETEESKTNDSAASSVKAAGTEGDDDEINSDLDDPDEEIDDDEEEEGAGNSGDIVIALYEKVQRVKNKWKVTLKDGLVSVGGKDYLFAKCSGEFDW